MRLKTSHEKIPVGSMQRLNGKNKTDGECFGSSHQTVVDLADFVTVSFFISSLQRQGNNLP